MPKAEVSRISWHLVLVGLSAVLMGFFVSWQYGATQSWQPGNCNCLGDQLEKLIHLKEQGSLSANEFRLAKVQLGLAEPDPPPAMPAPAVLVPTPAPMPPEQTSGSVKDSLASAILEGAQQPELAPAAADSMPAVLPRFPNHLEVRPDSSFYLPDDWQTLPLLPDSVWEKSLDMDKLDFPLMQALLLRLYRNETIRIQVYGGSMTFGEGCCTTCPMKQRHCSWPSQVLARLKQTFPAAQITLEHRARGGCDLECSLPEVVMTLSGSDEVVDWLILDFSQNGPGRERTFEEIVRICHFFLPNTLVMVIFNRDMANPPGHIRDKVMYENYRAVSKYYSLPFLNYEAAMQSFIETGGNQTLMWSSKSRHPLHSAHAFYADMVMYFCNTELKKLEAGHKELNLSQLTPILRKPKDLQADKDWMQPMRKQVNLGNIDVCMFPLTQHVAREPSKDSPTQSATGQWSLYEDRPNKPGWISTTENGEAISFKMTFSNRPKLMVQYLRSYTNIGDAEIYIDGRWLFKWKGYGNRGIARNFTLLSKWRQRISVTENALFVVENPKPPAESESNDAMISFRLVKGPKFKIISLISC